MTPQRRFPRSVFSEGREPDFRFTLANERTFLAWIRTALALLAGGVALAVLGTSVHPGVRLATALVLLVAGTALPALAWRNWMRTERAMRNDQPLPHSSLGIILGVAVMAAGALLVLGTVLP